MYYITEKKYKPTNKSEIFFFWLGNFHASKMNDGNLFAVSRQAFFPRCMCVLWILFLFLFVISFKILRKFLSSRLSWVCNIIFVLHNTVTPIFSRGTLNFLPHLSQEPLVGFNSYFACELAKPGTFVLLTKIDIYCLLQLILFIDMS